MADEHQTLSLLWAQEKVQKQIQQGLENRTEQDNNASNYIHISRKPYGSKVHPWESVCTSCLVWSTYLVASTWVILNISGGELHSCAAAGRQETPSELACPKLFIE